MYQRTICAFDNPWECTIYRYVIVYAGPCNMHAGHFPLTKEAVITDALHCY